jgi:hypothetical protein
MTTNNAFVYHQESTNGAIRSITQRFRQFAKIARTDTPREQIIFAQEQEALHQQLSRVAANICQLMLKNAYIA